MSQSQAIPKVMKAVILRESPPDRVPLYHDAVLVEDKPIPVLKKNEVLVKITAASFNRREYWQRLGQYPRLKFGNIMGADGVGIVIAAENENDSLLNKRVFLTPMRGWESHPDHPETRLDVVGGTEYPEFGTFAEYAVVERDQVILAPDYLDDEHLAAFPLAGLTAWRAVTTHAKVSEHHNVLITGIGGGVALFALQFCIALGANVYVTSGSDEKIKKAIALGAKAGFNYKDSDWPLHLSTTLNSSHLDSVLDGSGGDIFAQIGAYLKNAAVVVWFGPTASFEIKYTLREMMNQVKLIGTTMGSYQDLLLATAFLKKHNILPIISRIITGLDQFEKGFDLLANSDQFGKIILKIGCVKKTNNGV